MTTDDIKVRFEAHLAPLHCIFTAGPAFSKRITFRLRDGVGRETGEFAFALRDMQDDLAFEAAIEQVRSNIERNGFRHRR